MQPIIYRSLGKISWCSVISLKWLFFLFSIFVVLGIKPRHMPDKKVDCWSLTNLWLRRQRIQLTAWVIRKPGIFFPRAVPCSLVLCVNAQRNDSPTTVLASECVCVEQAVGMRVEQTLKLAHELGVGNLFPLHGFTRGTMSHLHSPPDQWAFRVPSVCVWGGWKQESLPDLLSLSNLCSFYDKQFELHIFSITRVLNLHVFPNLPLCECLLFCVELCIWKTVFLLFNLEIPH